MIRTVDRGKNGETPAQVAKTMTLIDNSWLAPSVQEGLISLRQADRQYNKAQGYIQDRGRRI